MGISERHTTEGTKKLLKKWRGPFMITEVHQGGRFYRLSTGRAVHYENNKPHNPSTEDWCIPADMEDGDYLMMDPVCEVNEKGTREKNDGNEVVEEGTSPRLDLDPNEVIEADEETLTYAEEDCQDPEQREVPKNLRTWNRIFRSRFRLDRMAGQDPRRNITLTATTL